MGCGFDDQGQFQIFGHVTDAGEANFVMQYGPTFAMNFQGWLKNNGDSISGTWFSGGSTTNERGNFEISKQKKAWSGYYCQGGQ